jgi:hypothetical protein
MRITVDSDDDTLLLFKKYMKAWRMPLGKALSGLVRQGLNTSVPTRRVNGLLIFDPKNESPKVTAQKVRDLL